MAKLNILVSLVAVLTFSSLSFAHVTKNLENLKHMANIERSMDLTADPCNDFHQYACGRGVQYVDNAGFSEVKYILDIANTLKRHYPITGEANQNYAEKLNIYYQACENMGKSGGAPLLPFLDEVKPGAGLEWPLVQELSTAVGQGKLLSMMSRQSTNNIDFFALLGELFSYGVNDVLLTHRMFEFRGDNFLVLEVPKPTDIEENKLVQLFISLKLPRSMTEEYANEYVETHQELQYIYSQYSSSDGHVIYPYAQLKAATGTLSEIAKFLKVMLPHPAKVEEQLIYFNLPYIKNVINKQRQPEEARKLCNYLMIQFLLSLQDTAHKGYYLGSSDTKLLLGLNYVYYKHFYLPHKKEYEDGFDSTVKTFHKQFAETVAENRLNLTPQQLREVTTKLRNIHFNIGNLPKNITESMVEDYYSTLPDLDVNNFYKTELLVRKHAHLEMLTCPEDMFCQHSAAHAFYHPAGNKVVFPFNALAPPMYDWSWHPLFAVSILGFSAGHELVHSIDSNVLNMKQFTPSFGGNSLQVPGVKASITCLSEQNPTETINERLADVIGAQLAFRTYSREFGLQPEFTTVPWQKLFFLSLAQMFCGAGNDEDNVHDNVKLRVREIAMNSGEFAEAFQCPAGSKMNPVKKCSYI